MDGEPLNPQRVFHELSARLPDGCILTADSGSATNWWARHLRFRRGMRGALSGTLATMCPAIPYALAAKFAYPDRPVIAVEGDGAMQMNGINALIDVAKLPRPLGRPALRRARAQQRRPQPGHVGAARAVRRRRSSRPRRSCRTSPTRATPSCSASRGIRVDAPEDVGAAWDEALRSDGPVVLEAITDPEVPPLPPHIGFEQAKNLAKALLSGDPGARGIVRQSLKGKAQDLFNR